MIIRQKKMTLLIATLVLMGAGLNSAQASAVTVLSETNASKTVVVKLGAKVDLTLHSMYWQFAAPAKSSSLTSKGKPTLKPIFPGPNAPRGCQVVGSGCGSQSWHFVATKVGLTHLVASRTTCGEAMRCTGTSGSYTVTVRVAR